VAGVNITEFATARQAVPVQEHGKIQLAETEVATVPEPSTPVPEPSTPVPEPSTPVPEVRPGWTPEDLASGVRVTASGGFQ
jgi:hypothetical protein